MVPIIQLFKQLSLIFSMELYEFVVLHFISIRQLEILTVFIAFIDQVFPVSMILHTWTECTLQWSDYTHILFSDQADQSHSNQNNVILFAPCHLDRLGFKCLSKKSDWETSTTVFSFLMLGRFQQLEVTCVLEAQGANDSIACHKLSTEMLIREKEKITN